MTIARAQIGSQMKGNKMKKKMCGGGVKKKGMGGLIPLGIVPQLAYQAMQKNKAKPQEQAKGTHRTTGGRTVKAAKSGGMMRGDGICRSGKTKGTMR